MKTIRLTALFLGMTAVLGAADAPPPTLTMEQAKDEALRNHPAYAAAQLRALLAKEALKVSQAAYYPLANGYVDAVDTAWDNTRILAGGINNPSVYDRVGDGIAVTQMITDFGHTRNLAGGARAELQAAAQGAEASREQILLNVEASYYAALQARAVLEVARQTLSTRQVLVEQVGALAKHQLKSGLDVSFSQVAFTQAELLVQKAEGDSEGAMAALGSALGRSGADDVSLVDERGPAVAPGPLSVLIEQALARRPDLLNLQFKVEAAQRVAAAARDSNYPTLTAVGVAGNAFAADSHLPDKYAAAGVQLTIPIFEGGAMVARQREAEISARISAQALKEAQDNAVRDVRVALASAVTAYKRLATTRQLLSHASEALDLAQARYKAGSSSIVEFSDAQLNQTYAAIALANAEYDTRIQEAVLDFQTGAIR
ncbi:MAG TPA: TolC family protein [Opitutaceae bacterium]|nr:TolC family protein [Opitutaceae bacterium]